MFEHVGEIMIPNLAHPVAYIVAIITYNQRYVTSSNSKVTFKKLEKDDSSDEEEMAKTPGRTPEPGRISADSEGINIPVESKTTITINFRNK